MRAINRIVVHHSASMYGDAKLIDRWHKDRGWKGIGYHYCILNGRRSQSSTRHDAVVGRVERGRPDEEVGAHCSGYNEDSIGICLIGEGPYFHIKQISALVHLIRTLFDQYDLGPEDVYVHRELGHTKCPGFDGQWLRELL